MKIYSCNYLKVRSDILTVYSVVYHDNVATVLLTAIIIFAAFILSLHLYYCDIVICKYYLMLLL